jgi:hypothetical protein
MRCGYQKVNLAADTNLSTNCDTGNLNAGARWRIVVPTPADADILSARVEHEWDEANRRSRRARPSVEAGGRRRVVVQDTMPRQFVCVERWGVLLGVARRGNAVQAARRS